MRPDHPPDLLAVRIVEHGRGQDAGVVVLAERVFGIKPGREMGELALFEEGIDSGGLIEILRDGEDR